jgi:tripartite-type tricarboxylate transporter receptor subunit TctC
MPYGVGGPAGMPETAKARLAVATAKVRRIPGFKQELANLGLHVFDKDGRDFQAYLTGLQDGIANVVAILKSEK